jgi:chromosome partitioning protein
MRTLAAYSIKGGVGKTAAAVNLAYLASQQGDRTLVWDLDAQGAATYTFRIKPKVKGGVAALVTRSRELDTVIKGTDHLGLDLVPADFSYRLLDLALDREKKPTRRLGTLLGELRGDYDVVILDCPPGASLACEAMVEAADAVLVPVVPTPLSLRTLDQLGAFVAAVDGDTAIVPFLSMVDRRRKLHREICDRLRAERPDLLRAVIPASADVERMSEQRAPLFTTSPRSPAADGFRELWREIRGRVCLGRR